MVTIPKSLLTTETGDKKLLIHPKYKLLKHRLEVVWFKDIRTLQHGAHSSFKKMEKSITDKGLLFPLVLNTQYKVMSGTNRCKIIRRYGQGTLAYIARTTDEAEFLAAMNKEAWCLSESEKGIESFEFLFKENMRKYTEKAIHLLREDMRKA
tara:strand:+ start:430 stop:885 length:456 start_codon:yes stop_codon:yes gene_type:complete